MKRAFLIGFMGSGKSTIGHALKKKHDMDFTDTDHYIEENEQRKIKDIFAAEGEEFFRELETEALESIDARIISTGGGIVERPQNIEIMKARGTVIFLFASIEEIARRLESDQSRPLWKQDNEARRALFERRQPLYRGAADLVIDTEGKTAEEIADIIYNHFSNE